MARTVRSPKKIFIYLAVAVAFAALAFLLIGDRTLLAVGKTLETWGRTEASTTTFQTLVNLFPASEYAAEGLLRMAKSTPPERRTNRRPRSNLGGIPLLPEMTYFIKGRSYEYDSRVKTDEPRAPEKIAYLERLLEQYPESKWRIEAIAELGYTMIALGRYDEAAEFLQQAWNEPEYREADPWSGLWLAQTYLNVGDPDNALHILIEANEEVADRSADLHYAIALAFENLGAYDQAYEIVTNHLDMLDIRARLERTYAQRTDHDEPPSLSGTVTLNGQSIAGIRIYLVRDIASTSRYPYPTVAAAQAHTDGEGRFEVYGMSPGAYHISLALPAQMARESSVDIEPATIEIKEGETAEVAIRFERSPFITHVEVIDQEPFPVLELAWEEDPRAVAYQVGIEVQVNPKPGTGIMGLVSVPDPDAWTFKETAAQISLEELYTHAIVFPYSPIVAPEDEVDATRVLGLGHTGVSAHFFVWPIGADGEHLGNSTGVWEGYSNARRNKASVELPSILSAADELLLQRNYDAAIAAYKERLNQDPYDEHSLFALWVLFSDGTDGSGSNKDPDLAEHYGERFLALVENRSVREWIEDRRE